MKLSKIGEKIRAARQESGFTQARLAAMAGISRATLNGLEKGAVRELGFLKLDGILKILGYELAPTPAPVPIAGRTSPRASAGSNRMKQHSTGDILRRMARRYIWWQPQEKAGSDPRRIMAQVMDLGTLEDIQELAKTVGKKELAAVLRQARPGWFRPKSWAFWHTALSLATSDNIPPMPERKRDGLPDPP